MGGEPRSRALDPARAGYRSGPVVAAVGLRLRAGRPEPRRAGPPVSLPAAVGYSLVTVACVAEVLAAWNHPTNEWDSWAFWVPKARLLYEMGHLHVAGVDTVLRNDLPAVRASRARRAFAFMGASDDVALHLQTALFFVAFVHGVATISRRFASDLYVVPFALLLATMPEVLHRALQLDGDYPTEFAFVLGALCCVIFLREPARWPLVYAAILLAAAANARREGLVYVAAVFAGAIALGVLRRRNGLWLALPAVAAAAAAVPWLRLGARASRRGRLRAAARSDRRVGRRGRRGRIGGQGAPCAPRLRLPIRVLVRRSVRRSRCARRRVRRRATLAHARHLRRLDACRDGGRNAVASALVRRPARTRKERRSHASPEPGRSSSVSSHRSCSQLRCRLVASGRIACCDRRSAGCRSWLASSCRQPWSPLCSCRGCRGGLQAAKALPRRLGRTSWSSAIRRPMRRRRGSLLRLPERFYGDDDRNGSMWTAARSDRRRLAESRKIDRG